MALTNVAAPIGPGPAVHAFSVTPSDTTVFTTPTRRLWVGGAGNVVVLMNADSSSVTFNSVAAGTPLEISVVKVLATGTTATNIVALY